ncbi:MAG TPA: hypothetical protein DCX14_00905 [Flavobacteriales bacterium]|nr:hypothetical protein [Flavobacteriales bacterium]
MKNLDHYERLVEQFPSVTRKGKTMPYTSLNGHMFSFLDKEGKVSIRFSDAELEIFLEKYSTEGSIQHNSVMRGYAIIPQDMLEDTNKLVPYFQKSLDYIGSLKPKPTKKPK